MSSELQPTVYDLSMSSVERALLEEGRGFELRPFEGKFGIYVEGSYDPSMPLIILRTDDRFEAEVLFRRVISVDLEPDWDIKPNIVEWLVTRMDDAIERRKRNSVTDGGDHE